MVTIKLWDLERWLGGGWECWLFPPEDSGLVLSNCTQSHFPAPVILLPKDSAPSSGFHMHCTFMVDIKKEEAKYSHTQNKKQTNKSMPQHSLAVG